MGTPTCSYCYGRHNIMSCEKLGKDYEVAKPAVDAWTEEDDLKESQGQFTRWYFKPLDREDLSKGYRYENADENGEMDEYYTARLEQVKLPVTITKEEYDEFQVIYQQPNSISHQRNIVRKYEEIAASRAKRAAKSCSYCKGAGHTVRTCQQRKDDVVTYENAILLDSYYKAKALSEFGLWTASVIVADTDSKRGCFMLSQQSIHRNIQRVNFPWDLNSDDGVEVETQFLASVLENLDFTNTKDLGKSDRYYSDTISGYDYSYCLDTKKIVLGGKYSNGGEEGEGSFKFLPTNITFEYIFSKLAQRVSELPKGAFGKDTEVNRLQTRRSYGHENTGKRISVYGCSLIEGHSVNKKQRDSHTWEKLAQWCTSQEEILNKIHRELV